MTHRRFRLAVVLVSAAAAIAGSVVLVTRHTDERTTTSGITWTLHVPGHPGSVAAGSDALWIALADTRSLVRDEPLFRLDLASGRLENTFHLGGQASYLLHSGARLLASVEHAGARGAGPSLILALNWRSGEVIHSRQFPTSVGPLAQSGKDLWALEVNPATLLRLDVSTLRPTAAPLPLSAWQGHGLAAGGGYVWATVPDTGDVLRIDPRTRAIVHAHVGGFPDGITVRGGTVWYVRRDRGELGRLAPRTLQTVGRPIRVGGRPTWLAPAGRYLFVGDAAGGTVSRIDVRSATVAGLPIRVAEAADGAPVFRAASAGGSVWVGDFTSSTLTRISSSSTVVPRRASLAKSVDGPSTDVAAFPPGGKVVATIPLARGATAPLGGGALAVGEGAVWAISAAESKLMRIDPKRNAIVAKLKIPPTEAMAAGDGAVWLANPLQNTVTRVDADGKTVAKTIHVSFQPLGIAVSPGAVWVANAGGPSVSVIDPRTNKLVRTIRIGPKAVCCSEHMGLTASPSGIWVAIPNEHVVVRIDPATGKPTETIKLPYCDLGFIVADRSTVWSDGGSCSSVVGRVDVRAHRFTGKLYEPHAVGLGLAFGSVWVAVLETADIDRIDPRTARVTARLHVGGVPVRLAVGFGSIWVNDDNGRVLRIQPLR